MTNNHDIKKLTDYQHVRKRVNMYLGPNTPHTQYVALFSESGIDIKELTWIPAAFTAVREVIDNSLDEFVKSKITNGVLTVDYDESNLSFVVSDNGRGIPTDWSTEYMSNLATMVVTELKAGRNFDDSERKSVGGMNGIGVSAVCQICERMELTVIRKGTPYKDSPKSFKHKFVQLFEEGTRYLMDDLMINVPKIASTSSTKTGTSIAFTLSKDMFPVTDPAYAGKILPPELLRSLLVEIAVNHPEYDIVFNSEKIKVKNSVDKAWFNKPMSLEVLANGFKSTFYIQPTEREDWFVHSSVNNIPVFDGGTHIDGFKTQFALGVIRALEKESKRKKLKPNRTDIEAGLFVYNVTEMDAPFFSSQAKTKLTNEESTKIVSSALTDEFFDKITKTHKQWISNIFERCAERTNKKDADEATKQAKKLLKQKIAKLCDATGKRGNTTVPVQEKILFLTEGDCLHEDTDVYILTERGFESVPVNRVVVGDHVVTDNNRLRPVIAIATKVANVVTLRTKYGDIKATPEHRLFVCDETGSFVYKMIKDIRPGIDRLVRNKIVEHSAIDKIDVIVVSDVDEYDVKIILTSGAEFYATTDHKFGVINIETGEFATMAVKDLSPDYGILFK